MLAAFDNKKLYSNRSRLFGVLLLCVLISMSMIGWAMNVDPAEQNLSAVLMPPGAEYWLGSDHYGRNMFARLSEALRLSLSLAIICVLSASTIGCILGVIAGWYGRWLDNGLNIIVNHSQL